MKIAVTYEDGMVFQHFGHTQQFKVYDIEDGKVVGTQVVGTNGQGHGALAGFLLSGKVDTLICGGIGGGAQAALAEAAFPAARTRRCRRFLRGTWAMTLMCIATAMNTRRGIPAVNMAAGIAAIEALPWVLRENSVSGKFFRIKCNQRIKILCI